MTGAISERRARALALLGLALAWGGALALSYHYGRDVLSYHLMSDELSWSGLALGVAENGWPSFRGQLENLSVLYAYLTAPAYLLDSMPDALRAARLLGAVWMASTVVPVYLLVRRLVEERWIAVLTAALSVAVPWLAMSAMLMSETVAYPAFAWALLACHHAILRHGPGADAIALAGIGLAFLGRTQLIVLLPALAGAIVLYEVGVRAPGVRAGARANARAVRAGLQTAFRGHPLLAGALVLGTLVYVLGQSTEVLGSYGIVLEGALFPGGWFSTSLALVSLVAVGIGLVPLVLTMAWAVTSFLRPSEGPRHAFACLLMVAIPVLTLSVAFFVINFGIGGLQDRYLLYLVPLAFAGMATWFTDARPSWVITLGVAGLVGLMLGQVPWQFVGHPDPSLNIAISPAAAFHKVIDGRIQFLLTRNGVLDVGDVSTLTVLRVGLVAGVLALLSLVWFRQGRRVLAVLGAGLLAFGTVQAGYVLDRAQGAQYGGIPAPDPLPDGITRGAEGTWVDPLVPDDAVVALVPWRLRGYGDIQDPWWDTELRNRSVRRAFRWGDALQPVVFANPRLELEPSGRLVPAGEVTHLVTSVDWNVFPRGRHIAFSPTGYLRLIELQQPASAEASLAGFSPELRTVGDLESIVRVYGPPDAERPTLRELRVMLDLGTHRDKQRAMAYELRSDRDRASGALRPGEIRTVSLAVCVPAGGQAEVSVSSRESGGEEAELGVRVLGITGRDVGTGCRPGAGEAADG